MYGCMMSRIGNRYAVTKTRSSFLTQTSVIVFKTDYEIRFAGRILYNLEELKAGRKG